jgi:hypothetical protein
MPEPKQIRYSVSLYIMAATAAGTLVGALGGALLDGAIESRRGLAILAALLAVAADVVLPRSLAASFPRYFLGGHARHTPLPLVLVAVVTALAAGLATHDIGQMLSLPSGLFLGACAGLLSALITATMVVLMDRERNIARGGGDRGAD